MTLGEFLELVTTRLDRLGIPYMVGGSTASSVHGEPRTTRDVDIVVEIGIESLESLFDSFDPSQVYADRPETQAIGAAPGQMYNLVDLRGGWKVDLVVRRDRPFSREEFARRIEVEVLGCRVTIATAEDVLLAKLEWFAKGGSSRQLDDAAGIVRVQGDRLDVAYLRRWAAELDVAALLDEVLRAHG